VKYSASKLAGGDFALLREHTFTRWLSRDLTQAAVDFCRNLGLVPIYSECSADHSTRYLFWRPPPGAHIEVRSGRPQDQFENLDSANRHRNIGLLALHINGTNLYSAVWISADHFETATAYLAALGISVAERHEA
jgi:hypothetical protein